MIHLVGFDGGNDLHQAGITFKRGSMEVNSAEQVVNARESMLWVFDGDAAHDAMHLVASFEKKLGKIAAVLARDAGDKSALGGGHGHRFE